MTHIADRYPSHIDFSMRIGQLAAPHLSEMFPYTLRQLNLERVVGRNLIGL